MSVLEQISENLFKGKAKDVKELVAKAVAEKVKPADIQNKGLLAGMSIIGERFKKNEVFVPEMLIAARAMKECMAILEPMLVKAGIKPKFIAEVNNLFNRENITALNTAVGVDANGLAQPGASFMQPSSTVLEKRIVQFGIRVDW